MRERTCSRLWRSITTLSIPAWWSMHREQRAGRTRPDDRHLGRQRSPRHRASRQALRFLDNVGAMTKLTAADGHSLDVYEVRPDDVPRGDRRDPGDLRRQRPHPLGRRPLRLVRLPRHRPALFDRAKPGVEFDYDAAASPRSRDGGRDPVEPAMRDLAATVAHVAGTGPVGVVGYCFGGSLAWLSAVELPVTAAVGYYGGADPLVERPRSCGSDHAALRRAR